MALLEVKNVSKKYGARAQWIKLVLRLKPAILLD